MNLKISQIMLISCKYNENISETFLAKRQKTVTCHNEVFILKNNYAYYVPQELRTLCIDEYKTIKLHT